MNNVVNIINFIRGPKCHPQSSDIITAVKGHLALLEEKQLPATFLVQYDAMLEDEIEQALKSAKANIEIGAWFEITQPLVEAAGEEWKGWAFWAHHPCYAFMMGYQPEIRKKLIDTYMLKFHELFGCYPKAVGAWMLDCVSLKYLKEKYAVKAACICREQCGTDGYTLWGGYYSGGYYPSEYNMLSPAQTKRHQIKLPVFRMLGPDPIRQYDLGIYDDNGNVNPTDAQTVCTLEPCCKGNGGGNSKWVDWFFSELVSGKGIGFGYAQAGQENSFGWGNDVKWGLDYQYTELKKLIKADKLSVEKLSETGEKFSGEFDLSPEFSMDYEDITEFGNTRSVWYFSRYYRINFLKSGDKCRIRDIHFFNEAQREIYYDDITQDSHSYYKTLPLIDGYNFSSKDYLAGGYIIDESGNEITVKACSAEKQGATEIVRIEAEGAAYELTFALDSVEIASDSYFKLCFKGLKRSANCSIDGNLLEVKADRENYSVSLINGSLSQDEEEIYAESCGGKIKLCFNCLEKQ